MRTVLVVVAIVLFILAGVGAWSPGGADLHEAALVAFGLAAFAAASLVPDRL